MKRFRTGIVGAGHVAPHHAAAVAAVPHAELVGVTDLDPARARALCDAAGAGRPYASLAELVAAGVDVVHVCTPPGAHAEIALAALELGCHVLVEKPLATRLEDCDALARAAERSGRRLAVNHSLLADPHVRRVLDAVRAGAIGAPVGATYWVSSEYPPWADGPPPPHYRAGGEPFRDLGVHGLYLLRAVLGEIEDVRAERRSHGGDPNLAFDEWHALVRCARGTGHLTLSWNVRPLQTWFAVDGPHGSLRADVALGFAAGRRQRSVPGAVQRAASAVEDGLPALLAVPRNALRLASGRLKPYQGLRAFVRAFYHALATGGPLPADVADGRSVVRWTEAVARAADTAKADRLRRYSSSGRPAVVVTGAGGLLGSYLVRRLLADGHRVRALVRRLPSTASADSGLEVVVGDLGDAARVAQAVGGATAVFHVGAAMHGDWAAHQRGTIGGTRHVVDACLRHGVPRLVHVSSLSVLDWPGLDGATVTEDAPLEPRAGERGFYTRAKLAAERLVLDAVRERGLPAVVVRPGAIAPPEGPPLGAANALSVGRWTVLLGRGTALVPLVDVADVVEALVRAARADVAPGTVLHVVDARRLTQLDVARAAAPGPVVRLPEPVVRGLAAGVETLGRLLRRPVPLTRYRLRSAQARLVFDCRRSEIALAWRPGAGDAGATVPPDLAAPTPATP
jgi:predicted dehydrogenase/nucleoside-diphosphate-sugar epimerase